MEKTILCTVLIIALLFTGTACGNKVAAPNQSARTDGKGQSETPAQIVAVIKVAKVALTNTLAVVGQVFPDEEVKVSPKSSGKIAGILVDVGQEVAAGEVLMELDSSDLVLQVQKDRIQLEEGKRNLDRKKELLARGAVAQSDYEAAESSYETDYLNWQQSENDLANTLVKSPIAGVIAARNVNLGETVSSSTEAFNVVSINPVRIKASLMEDEVNFIKTGQEVEVAVPAVSDQLYKGLVTTISPVADAKDKTYPFAVTVENTEGELRPGMFAELKLKYNRLEGVIVVPKDTVVDRNGKKVVYIVEGDQAVERPVQVGVGLNGSVEISEGLNSGDILITSGLQTMRDGKPVSIKGEDTVKKGN